MRENRTYGSEGGEAKAFPTPISVRGAAGRGFRGAPRPARAYPESDVPGTLDPRFREDDNVLNINDASH